MVSLVPLWLWDVLTAQRCCSIWVKNRIFLVRLNLMFDLFYMNYFIYIYFI